MWYTCYYVTILNSYVEFNISISTDGGSSWTKIWRFNDITTIFEDWEWYNTIYPSNKPIDLSAYAGYPDVKIAFQYYSNTTQEAHCQEFSIDDIRVFAVGGSGNPLECDAGGPYYWW